MPISASQITKRSDPWGETTIQHPESIYINLFLPIQFMTSFFSVLMIHIGVAHFICTTCLWIVFFKKWESHQFSPERSWRLCRTLPEFNCLQVILFIFTFAVSFWVVGLTCQWPKSTWESSYKFLMRWFPDHTLRTKVFEHLCRTWPLLQISVFWLTVQMYKKKPWTSEMPN